MMHLAIGATLVAGVSTKRVVSTTMYMDRPSKVSAKTAYLTISAMPLAVSFVV